MKTLILIFLLSAGSAAFAQQHQTDTAIGSWVIENNISAPKKQIVYFYDNQQRLIHQEYFEAKILRCNRKTVQTVLNQALKTALDSQQKQTTVAMSIISFSRKKH